MEHGQRATIELIRELQAKRGSTLISVYMPTVVAGPETRQNAIRFKNQLKALEQTLDEDDRRRLGDNWQRLIDCQSDEDLWQHTGQGMAWLVGPDDFVQISLPVEPPEHADAGRRFFVRPLFRALEVNQPFQLLTVSLNSVSLYRGDGHDLRRVDLPSDVPRSLEDAIGFSDADGTAQSHSPRASGSGAEGGGTVFHDQHEGEHSKERVQDFLTRLARALEDAKPLDDVPLVLGGTELATVVLSEKAPVAGRVIGTITGNLDRSGEAELHTEAWRVVSDWLVERRREALHELEETAPPRVEAHLEDVVSAALQGRVDTAFYLPGVEVAGAVDEQTLETRRSNDGADGDDDDLVDLALQETLRNGGRVVAVSRDDGELPRSAEEPVAALLRY